MKRLVWIYGPHGSGKSLLQKTFNFAQKYHSIDDGLDIEQVMQKLRTCKQDTVIVCTQFEPPAKFIEELQENYTVFVISPKLYLKKGLA